MQKVTATAITVIALSVLPPRKSQAEDSLDTKFMYYQEEKNRIRVMAPEFSTQHETESGWIIKLDGIFNAISGATPVGAPPTAVAPIKTSQPASSSPSGNTATSTTTSAPVVSTDNHDEIGRAHV